MQIYIYVSFNKLVIWGIINIPFWPLWPLTSHRPEHPEDLDDDDECLPVQGPINKEPDEKLYPERYMQDGSVIRKL